MRNRIKCNKCLDILGDGNYSYCKCGAIAHDNQFIISNSTKDFTFVDEYGNEIINEEKEPDTITRADMLKELDMMIKNFSDIPEHAALTPITHYDFASALMLVAALLRNDDRACS